MSNWSKDEYLRLLELYATEQYGSDNPIEDLDAWIPAEAPIKEKMKSSFNGCIDLTNCKRENIQDALYRNSNIKIGNFLIRITKHSGYIEDKVNLTMDISVWEDKQIVSNKRPCKIACKVNFAQDSRFETRPWTNSFRSGIGTKIPAETVVDVVKWLQAITRMTAFL